jgi:hypothetical protein
MTDALVMDLCEWIEDAKADPIFMAVAESMGSLGCGPKPRRMYLLA